ncbi:cAMP receptor-like protein, putative [Talaromyces stipitatus ATCC 10500]|uniref:cAMP receptor-like protein, putative n=1 Tax=Talaromyces stipitatus (strain ATCC 10500 / CBS 375.48 / QM 6759 / NRRL 1006) TaxID=441959 RepID=B8MFP3_TALSN|nr:cAMP receptor-like protein, putative [Talaromyces stipitatus ATCC 10500]EED17033.1 cAMP receptor-like protein, putative [Talaromyces stipitatus ATCC 10500]
MSLSDQQLSAITAAERVTSILSVVGTTIVISTFLSSRAFRKPINRVVFFASWANILTNVGTFISRTAIAQREHGVALCWFQGFLIQWLMPADALWTLAMAFNVYLTFFHKYDAVKLRRLEWKYLVLCYGLPFIPPFIYFFIHSSSKGPVYGSATLWCWVSIEWDILRIAVFYGPVWFVILLTFAIYTRVGIDISRKRRMLRSFNKEASMMMDERLNNLFEIHASKVVHVTSEVVRDTSHSNDSNGSNSSSSNYNIDPNGNTNDNSHITAYPSYSVTIGRGDEFPLPPSAPSTVGSTSVKIAATPSRRTPRIDISSAAFAYCKYAMLYFVALIVTWVPSTINRVYSLFYPDQVVFGLQFVSALVLPLQGFWNSIIYIAVSWATVMDLIDRFSARFQRRSSLSSSNDATAGMKMNHSFPRKSSHLSPGAARNTGGQANRRVSDDAESTTYFAKDVEGRQGI